MPLDTCHKFALKTDTELALFAMAEESIKQQTKDTVANDATSASDYLLTVGMAN